jgi:hypothetical protein
MSINGIGGGYGSIRPNTPARTETPSTQQNGTAQRATTPNAAKGAAAAPGAQALSVQPPQGTDPALWSVLTQDERSYFAKLGAMGPLTYGRVLSGQMGPSTPHVRGGRLDVKA